MWLDMLDWLTTGWNSDTHTSNRNCFYSHMAASGHMIESETWSETQELMEVVASVSNSKKYGLIPAGRRLEQSRAECDYITHESMQWLAVLLKCTLGDLCHTKKLLPSCWSLGGVRRGDGVCVCVLCGGGVNRSSDWNEKEKTNSWKIPEADLSSALGCRKQSGQGEWGGVSDSQSQMLPVDGDQCLIGLLSVADDLSNGVLPPQTLNLPVALQAKVEGVTPPGWGADKQANKQKWRGGVVPKLHFTHLYSDDVT